MTAVAIAGIPYVRQDRSDASQRMCGAAALCMVYRSLGLACCQAEVWQRIARSNGRGIRRTRTYLLATDAVSRGLAAMVIQASEPWPLLFQCQEQGVKVILSHRLRPGSRSGHYTVLLGLNEESMLLHDPQLGPERSVARDEFLELWRPGPARSEVAGHVLVAFAKQPAQPQPCSICDRQAPALIRCAKCRREMSLRLAMVLGCISSHCPARIWRQIYCPFCDREIAEI